MLPLSEFLSKEDAKIISELGNVGPRNIRKIAAALGIPYKRVYTRIRELRERGELRLRVVPVLHKLGLACYFMLIENRPGRKDTLLSRLESWPYCRMYGEIAGGRYASIALLAVPPSHMPMVSEFSHTLVGRGIIKKIEEVYVTDPLAPLPQVKVSAVTNADELINGAKSASFNLENMDEIRYTIKADDMDVFIISELEKDAFQKLSDLARKIKKSRTLIRYHYENHVRGNLVAGYYVEIKSLSRGRQPAFLEVESAHPLDATRVFQLLLNLPFTVEAFKEIRGKNTYAIMNLSVREIPLLTMIIEKFSSKVKIGNFRISFFTKLSKRFLPYELFREGGWVKVNLLD